MFWALSVHYGIANMDWDLSLENFSKCACRYLDLDVVLHFDYTASIGVASGLYWIRVSEPSPMRCPTLLTRSILTFGIVIRTPLSVEVSAW